MNGRFQMQGGKTGCRNRSIQTGSSGGISLAGNLVKPLLSLYGTEWRERGYGLESLLLTPPVLSVFYLYADFKV